MWMPPLPETHVKATRIHPSIDHLCFIWPFLFVHSVHSLRNMCSNRSSLCHTHAGVARFSRTCPTHNTRLQTSTNCFSVIFAVDQIYLEYISWSLWRFSQTFHQQVFFSRHGTPTLICKRRTGSLARGQVFESNYRLPAIYGESIERRWRNFIEVTHKTPNLSTFTRFLTVQTTDILFWIVCSKG